MDELDLSEVVSLLSEISSSLSDIKTSIGNIEKEMRWWESKTTMHYVLKQLENIEKAVKNIQK